MMLKSLLIFMLVGKDNPPLFRTPSCGAQGEAGHSRTELFKTDKPSLVEMLHDLSVSGREEIFFMQLPDCMPVEASVQKADPVLQYRAEKPAKKYKKPEDKKPAHVQAQVS